MLLHALAFARKPHAQQTRRQTDRSTHYTHKTCPTAPIPPHIESCADGERQLEAADRAEQDKRNQKSELFRVLEEQRERKIREREEAALRSQQDATREEAEIAQRRTALQRVRDDNVRAIEESALQKERAMVVAARDRQLIAEARERRLREKKEAERRAAELDNARRWVLALHVG